MFSSALLPLTICGIVIAIVVGSGGALQTRAIRQLVALVVVSLVASAGIYLIVQGWLGALPRDGLADWGALGA